MRPVLMNQAFWTEMLRGFYVRTLKEGDSGTARWDVLNRIISYRQLSENEYQNDVSAACRSASLDVYPALLNHLTSILVARPDAWVGKYTGGWMLHPLVDSNRHHVLIIVDEKRVAHIVRHNLDGGVANMSLPTSVLHDIQAVLGMCTSYEHPPLVFRLTNPNACYILFPGVDAIQRVSVVDRKALLEALDKAVDFDTKHLLVNGR